MQPLFRKSAYIASTALSLSLAAFAPSAFAYPVLPVGSDLDFTNTTGTPKGYFSSIKPAGWTGGGSLIFIDSTSLPNAQAASPVYLTTYGNPSGSYTGNYVEADGNPTYEDAFNRQISGLAAGTKYSLSFYQGASTQTGFGFNNYVGRNTGTTMQWIVALGAPGSTIVTSANGPVDPLYGPTDTYTDTDVTASIAKSPVMSVPYQGTVGFNYVSVTLTATATTEVLSFLAWGDNGSTVNLPPIAFLAGVNAAPGLGAPEPASLALFGVGLAGLGAVTRRRRGKRSTSA